MKAKTFFFRDFGFNLFSKTYINCITKGRFYSHCQHFFFHFDFGYRNLHNLMCSIYPQNSRSQKWCVCVFNYYSFQNNFCWLVYSNFPHKMSSCRLDEILVFRVCLFFSFFKFFISSKFITLLHLTSSASHISLIRA